MNPDPVSVDVIQPRAWGMGVARRLAERLRADPGLRVCLPTGTTPRPVYAAVPAALRETGASFSQAVVVLLDEYLGLPPDHRARCDVQLTTHLIARLAEPPARLLTFDVDARDPSTALGIADEIRGVGGLDLVLLGLGPNGHVGMNEPGTPIDARTRIVSLAPATRDSARRYGAERPPTSGVTLGMAEIMAAREIWLLVTGRRKARVLDAVLHGPITPDLPASQLRAHPRLWVAADTDAAG